jgi:sulfur carrier protein ThiS
MKKLSVSIRCYEELNDFLPRPRRRIKANHKRDFTVSFEEPCSIERLIVSLNIPPAEVDLVLVNGESVPFSHVVQDQDRVSLYPIFETFDISSVTRLRERPLRKLR